MYDVISGINHPLGNGFGIPGLNGSGFSSNGGGGRSGWSRRPAHDDPDTGSNGWSGDPDQSSFSSDGDDEDTHRGQANPQQLIGLVTALVAVASTLGEQAAA